MISLVGMIVCAIGFIGFASWHFWPVQTDPKLPEKTAVAVPSVPAPPSAPSVALRFVYPKAPALVIVNDSEAVARDIKWTVVLWNLDLPDRDEPLPIPVTAFDWIRAHNLSGPQGLFGGALVPPLLKPGNRLFGTASVVCPDCDRGRTYIVYIVWDQGGWYSEIEDEKSGNVIIPVNLKGESRAAYFAMLVESAAPASRVPIGPLQ